MNPIIRRVHLLTARWSCSTLLERCFDRLFACAAQTLIELAANARWMGVQGGKAALSLALHTWMQDLRLRLYLHAVMGCGVLAPHRLGPL